MNMTLMYFPGFKDKALTLSYDDGMRNDIKMIEIMSKYGIKGTFNINSGFLTGENRVHAEEFKKVYLETGNEIAVHGKNHLSLTCIPENLMIKDIYEDRRALEEITGQIITGMAYANGAYNDSVVDTLKKCGISYSRTTKSTERFEICDDWLRLPPTCHHNNPKLFELVEKFLDNTEFGYFWSNCPKLFYVWGHSYEFDTDEKWERFEKFAKTVGNKENVWYATNGEIVNYVNAYKSLVYSASGTLVYNPSSVDIYIKTLGRAKVCIPSGKTVSLV